MKKTDPGYPTPKDEATSARMRANPSSDTGPEIRLRSALHQLGYRFRKGLRIEAGAIRVRPDIIFTKRRIAVFVDGCFWHSCPIHGTVPATNVSYWEPKLRKTVQRDRAVDSALADHGWAVVRIWEHMDTEEAVMKVEEVILGV